MVKYYIGIDGGGTKSAVLVSDGRKDLHVFAVSGFNYNSFPKEVIQQNVADIKNYLQAHGLDVADCLGICIGSAGTGNEDAVAFLKETFMEGGFLCRLLITGDHVTALKGAFKNACGILLIAGTGAICYGQTGSGEEPVRAGGFGHLIDDGGSAYAIGRDLLHEVVMEWDGRKEKTILTKAVFAKIGITSVPELIAYIYDKKHTKREIAMIASILTDGELLALESVQKILENGAKELVSCVKAVAVRLHVPEGEKIPLVLAGSTIRKNKVYQDIFAQKLKKELPQIQIVEAGKDAVHGAVELLMEKIENQK